MSHHATFVSDFQASVQPAAPSFPITDGGGRAIKIPATAAEDFPYFEVGQSAEIRRYYDEHGYVVVRNLIPRELCEAAMARFKAEVKPYNGFIYRSATGNPERHVFTKHGYMLNSLLNIQSLDGRRFPRFRGAGLAVITHRNTQEVARAILGEPGKLVQSMYYEGNPATCAHQDTYYIDAEQIGRMTAAWFAMEDIAPGAGRFFVYPKSHLIDIAKNGDDFGIAFHPFRYKKLINDAIQRHGLECRAPALQQGDAVFFAAKTMHGSLETTQPRYSRSSFTAHYIPDSSRFLQFQARIRGLALSPINGMKVHIPRDLNRPSHRAVFWVETTFPRAVQTTKKIAIKIRAR